MELIEAINRFYYDMSLGELRLMHSDQRYPNITYNSLLYLDVIAYSRNCTITYLADALGISKPAATTKVGELIRQGLVVKTPSAQDRRVNHLAVHPGILAEYKTYHRILNRAIDEIEANHTTEEIAAFCGMLGIISRHYLDERKDDSHADQPAGKGF